jgi:hypothetical protein
MVPVYGMRERRGKAIPARRRDSNLLHLLSEQKDYATKTGGLDNESWNTASKKQRIEIQELLPTDATVRNVTIVGD